MTIKLTPNDSINETLKHCSKNDEILLSNGIYNEKVLINVDGISLIGESKNGVIIKNKDFFYKIMSDFNECNTFRTYTVAVTAPNVKIKNLTIENSSVPAEKYGQAVALHADGDNLLCDNVILRSEQDTLFTGPLPEDLIIRHQGFLTKEFLNGKPTRQIYNNCEISGNVDFIFGSAQALFNECDIISVGRASSKKESYVSAPSHAKNMKFGYLFYKCNLINKTNTKDTVYLSRPWRDYGTAAFINCNIENHINPQGFINWGGTERFKTARYFIYSDTFDTSKIVDWAKVLTKNEAKQYCNDFMDNLKK